jgi:dTDP-glucose pyrophosphorylase
MNSAPDSHLAAVLISPHATITDAMAQLDAAGTGALLLCEEDRKLFGILTDGDIRRAILRNDLLSGLCGPIATRDPVTVAAGISSAQALKLMNEYDVNHLPVIETDKTIVDLLLRRDLTAGEISSSAVIMAGGFGTRLRPLTENLPKPMLPVGDRPLLERTIEQLRESGIRRVNVTTHYLKEKITAYFGDGHEFGVELNYVSEDRPLGTAGGLRLVNAHDGPLLVINGDVITNVRFCDLMSYHRELGADVTVGVRKHDLQLPFGVVDCEGPRLLRIREKPKMSFMVNAGIYVLEPSVYRYVPVNEHFDMPDLIKRLLEKGRHVVTFPITEYWLDIGQPADYHQAQKDAADVAKVKMKIPAWTSGCS